MTSVELVPGEMDAGLVEGVVDQASARGFDVAVLAPPHHHQLALDLLDAVEGVRVAALAEAAAMDVGPVEADGGLDVLVERAAEREVPAEADAHGAEVAVAVVAGFEVVEHAHVVGAPAHGGNSAPIGGCTAADGAVANYGRSQPLYQYRSAISTAVTVAQRDVLQRQAGAGLHPEETRAVAAAQRNLSTAVNNCIARNGFFAGQSNGVAAAAVKGHGSPTTQRRIQSGLGTTAGRAAADHAGAGRRSGQ